MNEWCPFTLGQTSGLQGRSKRNTLTPLSMEILLASIRTLANVQFTNIAAHSIVATIYWALNHIGTLVSAWRHCSHVILTSNLRGGHHHRPPFTDEETVRTVKWPAQAYPVWTRKQVCWFLPKPFASRCPRPRVVHVEEMLVSLFYKWEDSHPGSWNSDGQTPTGLLPLSNCFSLMPQGDRRPHSVGFLFLISKTFRHLLICKSCLKVLIVQPFWTSRPGSVGVHQRQFGCPGDIWRSLETFPVVTLGARGEIVLTSSG